LRPNAVLMDLTLSGLSGWDALKALKADPRTSEIPVVIMTGHLVDTAANGPHLQAAAVLMKPFLPMKLFETLDRVISQRQRDR
jgi:CheY-like chemotaxis protein